MKKLLTFSSLLIVLNLANAHAMNLSVDSPLRRIVCGKMKDYVTLKNGAGSNDRIYDAALSVDCQTPDGYEQIKPFYCSEKPSEKFNRLDHQICDE